MVITDQLSQTDSNKVLAALLLRHRHQHQQDPIPRRSSAYNLLALGRTSSKPSLEPGNAENNWEGDNQVMEEEDGVIRLKIDESPDDILLQDVTKVITNYLITESEVVTGKSQTEVGLIMDFANKKNKQNVIQTPQKFHSNEKSLQKKATVPP